jgi:hypothetical protein
MSNIYAEAIKLNNTAVSMIQAGNLDRARNSLKKAMALMKVEATRRKQPTASGQGSSVCFHWSSNRPLFRFNLTEDESSNDSFSFIFRRALLIVPSNFTNSHPCYPEVASILYNLSLTLHLEAQKANNSFLFERALKSYQIARTIRRRARGCGKLRGDKLLDVAIHNNMAMIHQEMMDHEPARRCFAVVTTNLRSLGRSGRFLEHAEYNGLVLNILMNRLSQNTAAAAA